MNKTIYRIVDGLAHIMNVSSGEIMTFEIDEEDVGFLYENWSNPKLDLAPDVKSLFSDTGQANTRHCRSHLNSLGMDFSFPTIVNIELNRRCSLNCIHCYVGEKEISSKTQSFFERMTTEQINSFLDELKKLGVFLIVFTGGEPFLNKRLKEFVHLGIKKKFVIEIFSNLQFVPKWFKELSQLETMIGRIQTSVYSSDHTIHDAITRRPGSLERTLTNLCDLVKLGFYVEVATPLMKMNYSTWPNTKKFFKECGYHQDFSWPIVEEYYGQHTGKISLNISEEQFAAFCQSNPGFILETDFSEVQKPICEMGISLFSIDAKGNVYPCSEIPIPVGNIANSKVEEIYKSEEMQFYRNLKCGNTGIKIARNYCPGTNLTTTGTLFGQPDFIVRSIEAAIQKGG
ncbi:MAG: radical SAM protein [Patescibacteria group bacterium]|jgi:radical SAM protein with 4Fe4S-binding SPASM domain|nr:radical SAM protein [Patescibacteria group bacterium]